MKYFRARKSISTAGRRGLLLALVLAMLAVAGWLSYRGMVASTDTVIARRLATVQVGITALTCLLVLGAFVLIECRILVRHRQQTEEEFRESQERLSLAIAAANLGTWDRNLVTGDLIWSLRCFELFGISPEAHMTYRRFLEAIHPEDRERVHRIVSAAIERHEDYEAEMRIARPDAVRYVASRGHAHYDSSGRPTRMMGVLMDITQSRQAEEAVRQSEERLSLATAAANLGIWEWDTVTDNGIWSPRCFELFGISPDTHVTYQRFLEAVHPEDRERIDRTARSAVEQHKDFEVEMRIARLDAIRYIASLGRPYYDSSGRPARVSGVFMDITARKQAEDALRTTKEELARANQDLEERVRQRTAKLQEAMEELEHMSYSMIHDMRAPLRAMHGFATILEEEYAKCLPTEELSYPRLIRESAARLDQLVTDALNYNRVVRQDFPLTPVEIGSLLRGMIKTYPDLQQPTVHIDIEFNELMVWGNQSLLTQCFSNLLGNAVKFVAPQVEPHVHVRAETMGEMVRIWVEDNGIGIPKDKQDRLFRMFQRMHHEHEYPGTGIGLAIVRKAVERMGGSVGLESEPGKGSKFWIELQNAGGANKRAVENAA